MTSPSRYPFFSTFLANPCRYSHYTPGIPPCTLLSCTHLFFSFHTYPGLDDQPPTRPVHVLATRMHLVMHLVMIAQTSLLAPRSLLSSSYCIGRNTLPQIYPCAVHTTHCFGHIVIPVALFTPPPRSRTPPSFHVDVLPFSRVRLRVRPIPLVGVFTNISQALSSDTERTFPSLPPSIPHYSAQLRA